MAKDSIQDLLDREPFHPFRVRSSSGVAYEVYAPGLVVMLKSQVLIAEPHSEWSGAATTPAVAVSTTTSGAFTWLLLGGEGR